MINDGRICYALSCYLLHIRDGLMHVGCDSWAENVELLIPCDVIALK